LHAYKALSSKPAIDPTCIDMKGHRLVWIGYYASLHATVNINK